MDLFEITDAALNNIRREIRASSALAPVVSFNQVNSRSWPDGLARMVSRGASDEALRQAGLYERRFELKAVRWRLEPGVYERSEVSEDCLVAVRGILFSFTPAWQALLTDGILDMESDSLVLKSADGKVLLPQDLGLLTYHGEL